MSGNSATSCTDSSVDDDADDVTSWLPAFPLPLTTGAPSDMESEVWRRGTGFGGRFGAGRLTAGDDISINTSHVINRHRSRASVDSLSSSSVHSGVTNTLQVRVT